MPSPKLKLVQLTDQQQAVVEHNLGPALVFAVAGAGKTTALVHRVERLVRQGLFAPQRMLVTSFSRAAVSDLQKALARWPQVQGVRVSTLHALGLRVVRLAAQEGLLSLQEPSGDNPDRRLLTAAMQRARGQNSPWAPELESLDTDDFLSFMGSAKGNLRYASLAQAKLPPAALQVASQAVPPSGLEWYLELYQLYEQIRTEQGLLTFDDMLLTAWEVLVRHPALTQRIAGAFDAVLIDEFQDVNLAQSEILHLLSPHRNLMAVGDDDQTIYEWRGASPRFILEFEKRYGARKYLIADSFRCPAAQVVLAAQVIAHNTQRESKHLSLTKGFEGGLELQALPSVPDQARQLVRDVQGYVTQGYSLSDIAVLLRLYAQTPFLEQYLIEAGIPYRVVGGVPFYQRPEIQTLLAYLELLQIEHSRRNQPQSGAARQAELWLQLYNRPTRYLTRAAAEAVAQSLRQQTLEPALRKAAAQTEGKTKERLLELANLLEWLSGLWPSQNANALLKTLELRLDYTRWLRKTSGFAETAEGKVQSVWAFIDFARGQGSGANLLTRIEQLAALHQEHQTSLTLMTIFRSKGLEWPVVLVPDCNDGVLPFSGNPNLEEERRLFYVALTRSKRHTKLYLNGDLPSPFLLEAGLPESLRLVNQVGQILGQAHWGPEQLLTLLQAVPRLGLGRYLLQWWPGNRAALLQQLQQTLHMSQERLHDPAWALSTHTWRYWQTLFKELRAAHPS